MNSYGQRSAPRTWVLEFSGYRHRCHRRRHIRVCGRTGFKALSERIHRCRFCGAGAVMLRDYNAARNIKHRGLEVVGWGIPEPSTPNRVRERLQKLKPLFRLKRNKF